MEKKWSLLEDIFKMVGMYNRKMDFQTKVLIRTLLGSLSMLLHNQNSKTIIRARAWVEYYLVLELNSLIGFGLILQL